MPAAIPASRSRTKAALAPRASARKGAHHVGHGRRLVQAFDALEQFPALLESRDRLLALSAAEGARAVELATIVESDPAIALAVLRGANARPGRARFETAGAAIEQLGAAGLREAVDGLRTFDFFEHGGVWRSIPRRFRRHALITQQAADLIAAEVEYEHRDRLALAGVLHDVGKLVLFRAGYPTRLRSSPTTPEQRIRNERAELGVDHALIGGVLARRWGLPDALACAIERHHERGAEGDAAVIRLADALAHFEQGAPVDPHELLRAASALGLRRDVLRRVMSELPGGSPRPQSAESCPLTKRELAAVRGLARGLVYKQIGQSLGISASAVRTHLHNAYGKLGVADRAQAVLVATKAGWI